MKVNRRKLLTLLGATTAAAAGTGIQTGVITSAPGISSVQPVQTELDEDEQAAGEEPPVEFHSCAEVEITGKFEGVHLEASHLSGATDTSNHHYGSDLLSDDGTSAIDVSSETLFYIDYVRLSEETDIDPMSPSDEIDHDVDNPIEKSIEGCVEYGTGERPEASITFADQPSDGELVIADSVSLSHGGFVAVYDGSEDSMLSPPADEWNLQHESMSRTVVGASEYLDPGSHEPVEIELDEPLSSSQALVAIPHHDSTGTETYEFVESGGHADWLYYSSPPYDYAFIEVEADGATVDVTISATNDPVEAGEYLGVAAQIENPGDTEVTESIALVVGEDQLDAASVTLGPEETQTITLGYETYPVEQDVEFPVRVETDSDDDEQTVEVVGDAGDDPANGEGTLEVTILGITDPVQGGEYLEVTSQIENTGESEASQEVRLIVGEEPEQVDSTSVTIGPGETETVSLGYETYATQQDVEFPVRVETDEDADQQTVSVSAVDSVDVTTSRSIIWADCRHVPFHSG